MKSLFSHGFHGKIRTLYYILKVMYKATFDLLASV